MAGNPPPPAPAAAQYPDPPFDFARAPWAWNQPRPLYTPEGGALTRPLLVIDVQFDDLDYSSFGESWMAERFFGGFPSLAGYFATASRGRAVLA